ncbi:2726_t:CDS:2 [Scutellospora calospora]|uniref:2726_t:CDS:1 n=1 Tax=Scutellospora calospora TaxID=85575 RepID=A0ACA9MZI2_9GLOM|nr:2726_t:CDS:2 [Scutellospora calospora]
MSEPSDLESCEAEDTVLTNVESEVESLFTRKIASTEKGALSGEEHIFVNIDNPNSTIIINKISDEYDLNIDAIAFKLDKKFSLEIIEDIKFLIQYCNMGTTAQIKYLQGKYPTHLIYSKDLYAAIRKFRPIAKSLLNNAT